MQRRGMLGAMVRRRIIAETTGKLRDTHPMKNMSLGVTLREDATAMSYEGHVTIVINATTPMKRMVNKEGNTVLTQRTHMMMIVNGESNWHQWLDCDRVVPRVGPA
jgi:hypothetical protein